MMSYHQRSPRRATLSPSRTRFIGMDSHQASRAVASVAQEHGAAVPSLGTLGTRQGAIDQRLRTMPSTATHVLLLSAAGPCGSWLSRSCPPQGDAGWVVAPSLMPTKVGARGTTARRAAVPLARLARAGALPAGSVPQVDDDAMRDLTRARAETRSALQDAPCRRNAFVLRHALRSTGRAHGHPAHRRGLADVVCPTPAPPSVCHEDGRAGREPTERLPRLAQARQAQGKAGRVPPGGEALQALRGGPCPVAVTMVAALGDLRRVAPPRALRPCLGRPPAAEASGARRQPGALTHAGHPPARRALGAGA